MNGKVKTLELRFGVEEGKYFFFVVHVHAYEKKLLRLWILLIMILVDL